MSISGRNRIKKVPTSTGTYCYGCNVDVAKLSGCTPSSGGFVSKEMWNQLKNRNNAR